MKESLKRLLANHYRLLALTGVVALVLLSLFLIASTADVLSRDDGDTDHTITVTGTGKAQTPPTIATITFTVDEKGTAVDVAQAAATKKTDAALAVVKGLGIDDKDVSTSGYNTYPDYGNAHPCYPNVPCPATEPKIAGYHAVQTVTVKVRDTQKVGDLVKALGDASVQNISGPDFRVDDPTQVLRDARGKAITNARENAETLARQLGVHLGRVVNFSDSQGGMPYPVYDAAMKSSAGATAAPAPTVPAGEQESTVTVTVTYEIR